MDIGREGLDVSGWPPIVRRKWVSKTGLTLQQAVWVIPRCGFGDPDLAKQLPEAPQSQPNGSRLARPLGLDTLALRSGCEAVRAERSSRTDQGQRRLALHLLPVFLIAAGLTTLPVAVSSGLTPLVPPQMPTRRVTHQRERLRSVRCPPNPGPERERGATAIEPRGTDGVAP